MAMMVYPEKAADSSELPCATTCAGAAALAEAPGAILGAAAGALAASVAHTRFEGLLTWISKANL